MPAFATLNNTSLVQFFLEDTTLTVVADTPFTKQIISKPEVTEALEDVCSKQWGKSISVHCRLKAELDSPSAERTFSEKEASNGREKKEKQDKLEDLIALCQGMDVQVLD